MGEIESKLNRDHSDKSSHRKNFRNRFVSLKPSSSDKSENNCNAKDNNYDDICTINPSSLPSKQIKTNENSNPSEIEEIFNKYQINGEIKAEGLIEILNDLEIEDVGSIKALWVAWILHSHYFIIQHDEFIKSFNEMKISSLKEMKEIIPANPLENEEVKKELYKYSFECNTEYKQRRIKKEESIELMYLFFGKENSMLNKFIEYLKMETTKPLNKDEWYNLYDFITTIHSDYSNYDLSGESCWPLLFDNFVHFDLKI